MAGHGNDMGSRGEPREVPGSYGRFPLLSAVRDRLDFHYFHGEEKYYDSRVEKYGSTVVRINVPPGPFTAKDSRVVALLDNKSFPVLFDTTKVDKANVLGGTFRPSLSLNGGFRMCAYLDPSEPTHAKVKQLLLNVLHSRMDAIIPSFHSHFSSLLATLESQIHLAGKSNLNTLNDAAAFEFICDAHFGVLPSASALGTTGPARAAKWLMLQLHPKITFGGVPMILQELFLHTVYLPAFLVTRDYKALYTYFYAAAADALDAAERIGLSREEACHNLLFATCFNAYGGLKMALPGIMARVAQAGEKFHHKLATEIRAAVAEAGGKVTMAAVEKMELTKSTVWEVMRLDPPVKNQFGRAKADMNIESHDGVLFAVKKGELLFGYQPCATRDPRVFGPTAREFVGDRFMGEEGRKLLQHLYWSNGRETENPTAGNKQCPGKDLFLLAGRLLLVEVFLRYDTFTANITKGPLGLAVEFVSVTKATSGPGAA
ncbi:unnamed protein product [Alopecurus aequalis]